MRVNKWRGRGELNYKSWKISFRRLSAKTEHARLILIRNANSSLSERERGKRKDFSAGSTDKKAKNAKAHFHSLPSIQDDTLARTNGFAESWRQTAFQVAGSPRVARTWRAQKAIAIMAITGQILTWMKRKMFGTWLANQAERGGECQTCWNKIKVKVEKRSCWPPQPHTLVPILAFVCFLKLIKSAIYQSFHIRFPALRQIEIPEMFACN